MSCENALTSQEIVALDTNVRAVNDWAEGGPADSATMANGRTVPSPSKVIADSRMFKSPAIAWPPGGTITDALQLYTDGSDDYAPNPNDLPFSGAGGFPYSTMYIAPGMTAAALADQVTTGSQFVGYIGQTLEQYLNNTAQHYSTLAVAIADINALAGNKFSISAYVAGNKSGVLFFDWVAGAAPNPGPGTQINHATLIIHAVQNFPGRISVAMFGAIGLVAGVVNDDTVVIQAAIDYVETRRTGGIEPKADGGIVNFDDNMYGVSSTLFVPIGVHLLGIGYASTLRALNGGTFTNDYMISVNSTDVANRDLFGASSNYNSIRMLSFENGDNLVGIRGILVASSGAYEDLHFRYMYQCLRSTFDYMDCLIFRNCQAITNRGSLYQFEINQNGDGLTLDNLQMSAASPGDTGNLIFASSQLGLNIKNCISGNIYLELCNAATITNFHTESGNVTFDATTGTMKDSYINVNNNPGVIIKSSFTQVMPRVTLDNVSFNTLLGPELFTNEIDVSLHEACTLKVINCAKMARSIDSKILQEQGGIIVANQALNPIVNWNDFSQSLSRDGEILRWGRVVPKSTHIDPGTNTVSLFNNFLSAEVEWGIATDTYYYQMQWLYDKRRLVGVDNLSGESSELITLGGPGYLLNMSNGDRRPEMMIVRVYRGLSAGVYTHYVDVPVLICRYLYDNGNAVNGYRWISRTAGGVDSIIDFPEMITDHARFIGYSDTIPSGLGGGNFDVGDIVYKITPVAGGFTNWVCITAGTSSVWKEAGVIAA